MSWKILQLHYVISYVSDVLHLSFADMLRSTSLVKSKLWFWPIARGTIKSQNPYKCHDSMTFWLALVEI